jgi:DNA polymerase-1
MILDHFTARPKHFLVEFDYKQLEIRVLALASRDKQLIRDINAGVDMHTFFASQIFNKPEGDITPKERRMAKGFSFQLQYGAGANGIARFWDVPKPLAEDFIKKYYRRYPQVKKWQEGVLEEASETLEFAGDMQEGLATKRGYIPSIWRDENGSPLVRYRVVADRQVHTQRWDAYEAVNYRISPTKTKNYPIQGAAADILMLMLNRLSDHLWQTPVKLLNTVHDSVLVEIPDNDRFLVFPQQIRELLEDVPLALRNVFNVHSPVAFPVDWSSGQTLAEIKENS